MHTEIDVEEINPSRRYEEFWVENRKAAYVTEPARVYERAAQHRSLEMVTAPRFHPSLLGPLFDVIFLFLFNCADRIAHKCAHTNSPRWDKKQKRLSKDKNLSVYHNHDLFDQQRTEWNAIKDCLSVCVYSILHPSRSHPLMSIVSLYWPDISFLAFRICS